MGVIAQTHLDLTAMHGRSRTSSTAVPDAALGNCSLRCSNSCIPAVVPPPSDYQGRWKCNRIVGTILAMESCVSRHLHVSATAPCVALGRCSRRDSTSSFPGVVPSYSDRQGGRKCKRIVGNNPCPVGRRVQWRYVIGLPEHSGQRVNPT